MMNLNTEGKAEKKETAEEKQGNRSLKRYLLEKMRAWINSLLGGTRSAICPNPNKSMVRDR